MRPNNRIGNFLQNWQNHLSDLFFTFSACFIKTMQSQSEIKSDNVFGAFKALGPFSCILADNIGWVKALGHSNYLHIKLFGQGQVNTPSGCGISARISVKSHQQIIGVSFNNLQMLISHGCAAGRNSVHKTSLMSQDNISVTLG